MTNKLGAHILWGSCLLGLGWSLHCHAQEDTKQEKNENPDQQLVLGLPVRINEIPGSMKLKVIEGALVQQDEWLVLLGGMNTDFTASPSIQLRTPQGTWRPVGAQMLEERINPWTVQLSDDRVFVWGGYGGSARTELIQLVDGELLNPRVAGSSKSVTPPPGIDWSGASNPIALTDDVVGMVVNDQLHRFDTTGDGQWMPPIPLGHSLQGPTLAQVDDGRVLACGTSQAGSTYQVVECDPSTEAVTLWPDGPAIPALGGRLHPLPDGRLLLVGWTRVGAGIEHQTLVIDPVKRKTTRGPSLPLDGGSLNWISSQPVAEGVLILATETPQPTAPEAPSATQPAAVGFLVRVNSSGALRVWALSNMPTRRRPMLFPRGGRSVELIGGYRFGAKGADMENTALLVNFGTGLVGD